MENNEIYISIGDKCQTSMALRELNLRKVSLPFDFISSNLNAINYYLKTKNINKFIPNNNYNKPNDYCNELQCWLGHFPFNSETERLYLVNKFNIRFNKLFNILNSDLFVYFIYSCTSLKHKIYDDNYIKYINDIIENLNNFCHVIQNVYNKYNFKIILIDNINLKLDINNNLIHYYYLNIKDNNILDDDYLNLLINKLNNIFFK